MKSIQTAEVDRMARSRYTELNKMLEERRSQLQAEVQEKMRDVRAEGLHGKMTEVFDAVESSEADIQEDIELALIQMKSETLTKVNDALVRLELGNYGYCFECGEEIAEKRLRALPFAVRCKDCEAAREVAEQRQRQQAQRRSTPHGAARAAGAAIAGHRSISQFVHAARRRPRKLRPAH
jgi:DnaK suppressor protein